MMGRLGDKEKGQHESSGYVRELRREAGRRWSSSANFVRRIWYSACRDNFSCHYVVVVVSSSAIYVGEG
jgi:hypothetical protein